GYSPLMTSTAEHQTEITTIDGLPIRWDQRLLRPRPWTAAHGKWAAELAAEAPAGPILELCSGAGHIGLVAARRSGRALVQVDREPAAAAYARVNADAWGGRHRDQDGLSRRSPRGRRAVSDRGGRSAVVVHGPTRGVSGGPARGCRRWCGW